MNKPHYSEADLLETHYLKPCMSLEVLTHLDSCAACADRFARLEEKLRGAAEDKRVEKPETFWARQKLAIIRRTGQSRAHPFSAGGLFRIAAVAVLAFFLGGVVVYETVEPAVKAPAVKRAAPAVSAESTAKTEDAQTLRDPWQSDELNDFHDVVKWESWVDSQNGGQS